MKLFEEYKRSLKHIEAEEPLDLFFYRIVSFIFVKIILPLPITPNQLSMAALVMGIISAVFYGIGGSEALIAAGVFYSLYYLFDLSDGQVARLKKNGTRVGRIIDGIADYVTHVSIFIGLGIGLGNTAETWILVIITLICLMAHVVLFDFYRSRYLEYTIGEVSLYGDDLVQFQEEYEQMKTEGGHYFDRFVFAVYLKYLSMQRLVISQKSNEQNTRRFAGEDFLRRNKPVIRLWSVMGSSLHISLLIVMSFINRIDLYLYGILYIINAYALIMIIIQKTTDKRTKFIMEGVN
ncbi:MAG: CDP-alcohol phosphatidyltransferase family protein [Calditrichaceae bacterium]|nr:CDP-alcohol phosphatidyltransferase family protein [Calditrichaceae bacterium]MBN2708681.1 CDP-alcohol phosphatidyltransferase family protein [Calditrichaceae bacterium]RQV96768.1 MAG: CDP-alcohol phosphatidyltransferase family protein [Calditrichota bacterium]